MIILALVAVSAIAGVSLLFVSEKLSLVLIGVPPAIVLGIVILRNPLYGVYAFFLYSTLRPYDFIPALIPLRLTMVIQLLTLTAWLIALATRKKQFRWSSMHTFFALFVGAIGVTVITADNNFFAYTEFQNMLGYLVICVIASDVIDSPKQLRGLVWMLLLIHAYFAISGIHNFLSGGYSDVTGNTSGRVASGFVRDENDFALAVNLMIPFALFGFQYLKGKAKVVSFCLLLLFVLAVVSSFSRGGMVGLAAVMLFALLVSTRKLLAISASAVVLLTIMFFAPSSYWKEAVTITDAHESTANARIEYWVAGMRMFAAHPIIGVGAGNGPLQMPSFYSGHSGRDPSTQWGRTFHGTWPQVLAELGLLGGVPYFSLMFLAFRYLFRIRRRVLEERDPTVLFLSNSLIGSLTAYIAGATFLSTAYYPQLWNIYALVMILVFFRKPVNSPARL